MKHECDICGVCSVVGDTLHIVGDYNKEPCEPNALCHKCDSIYLDLIRVQPSNTNCNALKVLKGLVARVRKGDHEAS